MIALRVAALYSGSSGNCLLVSNGHVHILVDAGVSAKRVTTGLRALDVDPAGISAVLITHEHSDHIKGLSVLCRQIGAELYATEPTARQICYRTAGLEDRFQVFEPGERFAVDDLVVASFPTSHDCACPVGYTVSDGKCKMALCTDTGVVTREAAESVAGCGLLVGEFNHDVDMLRSGPYPARLKARILSDQGHLSNEAGGEFAAWAVRQGARQVVLAHLSKENNRPELAMRAARAAMEGIGAKVGEDVMLTLAPRDECTGWLEVPPC